jgi:competence protein ComEC
MGGSALVLGWMIGAGWAIWQAQSRIEDQLYPAHHDAVHRLNVRIVELPQQDGHHYRFIAEVVPSIPLGIPKRLIISGYTEEKQARLELKPGQVWRMALIVRQPHGLQNPGAFDTERRHFSMGVLATATVRGTPVLLDDEPWSSVGVAIERMRDGIRAGMLQALGQQRYAPVMIALAMGDQAAVSRDDWQIFNRSGITHLVSISGMHVTLIAAFGGVAATYVWRRVSWRRIRVAEYCPAQVVGAVVALAVALFYCLLAGWGVPARRTFFMLAVVAVGAMLRVPLSSSRILMMAGAVVTLFDPWATLAPGFWLSFGAVAILLRVGASIEQVPYSPRQTVSQRVRKILTEFSVVQGAITLGLVPLLALLMGQISLVSPLVNAYAIPIVSFLVTPLALVCATCSVMPGCAWVAQAAGLLGHAIFDVMMIAVTWMSTSSWAVLDVPAATWPWWLLALFGVIWAVQPPGLPGRWMGWLLILPMLCWRPETLAPGYWRMTALDVGQGSAIVVETATQVLLFDTGPASRYGMDAGERVVIPFLRTRGHRELDVLVVSHADMDHAGGVKSVIAAMPVTHAYSSFNLQTFIPKHAHQPRGLSRCQAGKTWQVDEVQFSFLHPHLNLSSDSRGNAQSCVLLIQGKAHSLLLPGDIGVEQERLLIDKTQAVDVVLAPHHGSKTSSSERWVQALKAQHVIAQVGYMNQFQHPTPLVQARWVMAGAQFWRTDHHGAVVAMSHPDGLQVVAERDVSKRYWHYQPVTTTKSH